MRLPLLVSASPSLMEGPTVMLRPGKWKIEHNAKDSALALRVNGDLLDITEVIEAGHGNTTVSVAITQIGREKYISCYILQVG